MYHSSPILLLMDFCVVSRFGLLRRFSYRWLGGYKHLSMLDINPGVESLGHWVGSHIYLDLVDTTKLLQQCKRVPHISISLLMLGFVSLILAILV